MGSGLGGGSLGFGDAVMGEGGSGLGNGGRGWGFGVSGFFRDRPILQQPKRSLPNWHSLHEKEGL